MQATCRITNEKYRRTAPLDGAARLQISANNEDVLELNANLTDNDVGAIAERFTHIRCESAAAVYLYERGGTAGCESWIGGDGLPAHVLYLANELHAEWRGRFGVEQEHGLANTLAIRSGTRALLCELFVRVLRDPAPLADGALVVQDTFVVHVDWILRNWAAVLNRVRQPVTSAIIKALDGLGARVECGGEVYTAVDTERLAAWAWESGYGTPERVREWLKHHA